METINSYIEYGTKIEAITILWDDTTGQIVTGGFNTMMF